MKLKWIASIAILLASGFVIWLIQLDRTIQERIDTRWFVPPVEFYARPQSFFEKQQINRDEVVKILLAYQFNKVPAGEKLRPLTFSLWATELCQGHLAKPLETENINCLAIRTAKSAGQKNHLIVFDLENSEILGLYSGQPFSTQNQIELPPRLFAQYYGDQPILRRLVELGDVPLYCLQAVTAIEDKGFLQHKGVSFKGILRAAYKNLAEGRVAEGGSTITQQLVKNYFLTSDRSFRRKFKELFMALILETRVDKDKILENYLNVIYMGQNGPFQVRGFGAAAEFYFGKKIENLNVAECSLLSAIVNSPGRFNPFRNPENALKRREKVLRHMLENNMIDSQKSTVALAEPLPQRPPKILSEPAPYFLQAVRRQLKQLEIDETNGLRVFTTLAEWAQETAQNVVQQETEKLEQNFEVLKNFKTQGKDLQSALISVDLRDNEIIALVGGRQYRRSQYNRILDAHRQVGSVMKPFVYLTALESIAEDGSSYSPLSLIPDLEFEHKYEGQTWSPQNYDKTFHGNVPMFYALKNSFNVATARLGLQVGLDGIVDMARRLGVESKIEPLPSLTLGAYELYPFEVAQAYSTIARMGEYEKIHVIKAVENLRGESLYTYQPELEQRVAPETVALLVGMMKQTLRTGTGRSITTWRQFRNPAAGKTGTTSDFKDAWFAGFTPYTLTIIWVGYDDNTAHKLTGSSGAIPIWTQFMKSYARQFPAQDFTWPAGTETYELPSEDLFEMVDSAEPHELDAPTPLIIRTGR